MDTRCWLHLIFATASLTIRAWAQEAVALPPRVEPPTSPTTPATPLKSLKPQPGEISLWGYVQSFDAARSLVSMKVNGFTLPNGRSTSFALSKTRTVQIVPQTTWLLADGQPWSRELLRANHRISVIGPDVESGLPLQARLLCDEGEDSASPQVTIPGTLPLPLIITPSQPTPPSPARNSLRLGTPLPPSATAPTPPRISPMAPPRKSLPAKKPSTRAGKVLPPRLPFHTARGFPKPPMTALMALNDITPWLRRMAAAHPDQMQIQALSITAQGRPVLAIEIKPVDTPAWQLRRLAVVCRQHGDEPETTAAAVEFIHQFLTLRTARAYRLRQQVALLIVPVANPDGARSKRRNNGVGQDLNRDWGRGHSREVSALMELITPWNPHLVVDVHQWVPGDSTQTPMAEACGGQLARSVAASMAQGARSAGLRLAFRTSGIGGALCHRYWAARGIPAILLETIHKPGSSHKRQIAVRTSVLALQRALDSLTQ